MQIKVDHLFPVLDKKLIQLLKSLSEEEWHKPTIACLWTVKDIAAHLLDGNIRVLSMERDRYFGETPENIDSYKDMVNWLNQLNADWVKACKRISPNTLIHLHEVTGPLVSDVYASMDPDAEALFPVAWAGEETSKNWMHLAREYTEKWHHQQQIRDAVDKPGIMTEELFHPFIDTFMRGLPHAFKDVKAAEDTSVRVTVHTDIGGTWSIRYREGQWRFVDEITDNPDAVTGLPPQVAWKLFSKGITPTEARSEVTIEGDEALGNNVLNMISVMA